MLFRRSLLCLAICTALQTTAYAAEAPAAPSSESEEVEFNDQFLFNTGTSIDVSRFSRGNPVVPGTFKTQVILNGQKKLLTDFTFKDNGTPRATPCFTAKLLLQAGVKEARLKEVTSEESFDDRAQESCLTLDKALPGSS